MINVRRLTVIVFLGAGLLPGISAQESSVQTAAQSEMNLPAQWDLQSCIDYALQQNITIRKNRVNAESTQIDVKTAKATLFPSLSFSTSQNMVNRPYQESSRTISGSEVIETTSKTSYNGNYGLNASWTIYNEHHQTGEAEQSGSQSGCRNVRE
jgi:outer membrane protein